jgi:hypothetical protein
MVIDQGRHRVTEDSKAAGTQPCPAESTGLDPPIDGPPAYVQNPSCLVNTEKSFLLQCEYRVHHAFLHTRSECLVAKNCDQSVDSSLIAATAVTTDEDIDQFGLQSLHVEARSCPSIGARWLLPHTGRPI